MDLTDTQQNKISLEQITKTKNITENIKCKLITFIKRPEDRSLFYVLHIKL